MRQNTFRIVWLKNTIDPVSSRENPFICSSSAAISAVRSNSGSFVGKIALIQDKVESLLRSFVETVSSDWLEVSVWSAASDWLEVSRQEPTPESSSDTEPRLPALSNFPVTTLDETKESGIDEVSLSGCEEITTISGRLSEYSSSALRQHNLWRQVRVIFVRFSLVRRLKKLVTIYTRVQL